MYPMSFVLTFQAVGLAMRRLNEMGVFTVFVILDSLSKVSFETIMP